MYEDLTGIQILILEFVKDETAKHGYPPSVREICSAIGLRSTSSVFHQLHNLEVKGYIRRNPLKPRAIEILKNNRYSSSSDNATGSNRDVVDIPVMGFIPAGDPIKAIENVEETFPLPASLVKNQNCFMLKVKGNSMINAGILDADYVIVRQQSSARDGDIVVALMEDEATVKTFYRDTNRIRLQPENPMMAPLYFRDVTILGKVIGVFRII